MLTPVQANDIFAYIREKNAHFDQSEVHGIQHASRTAIYIKILDSLNKHYGNNSGVSDKDLELLQIAALFHDAARKGDGNDIWELHSAKLLYNYLTKEKEVDSTTAKLLAETIANKDLYEPGAGNTNQKYKYLRQDVSSVNSAAKYRLETIDGYYWSEEELSAAPQNRFIKLLHDADCLDIIRARDGFEGFRLHFYEDVAKNNDQAFNDLVMLICDIRKVISDQGDARRNQNATIKTEYKAADNTYEKTLNNILDNHSALRSLYENDNIPKGIPLYEIPEYNAEKGITAENLTGAIFAGKIFARSICFPSEDKKRKAEEYFEFTYMPPVLLREPMQVEFSDINVNLPFLGQFKMRQIC